MALAHHPRAVPADRVIADIERRRPFGSASSVGYECLFISARSTRPAMEFELFPEALTASNWRAHVAEQVRQAMGNAEPDEAVYFEPY
jgi:hypothetical protein